MKKEISNDEIDFSDLILSLWKNKFKILVITTSFIDDFPILILLILITITSR